MKGEEDGRFTPVVNKILENSTDHDIDLEESHEFEHGMKGDPTNTDVKKTSNQKGVDDGTYPMCDTSLLHPEQPSSNNYVAMKRVVYMAIKRVARICHATGTICF